MLRAKDILSINIDGRVEVLKNLRPHIAELEPLAVMLQDVNKLTYEELKELVEAIAPNYQLFVPDWQSKDGDAACTKQAPDRRASKRYNVTLVRNDATVVDSFHLSSLKECSLLVLKLQRSERATELLINVYVRPKAEYEHVAPLLEFIKHHLQSGTRDCSVMAGDFNAHSPEWAPPLRAYAKDIERPQRYKRGRQIARFVGQNRLTCLNRIEEGPTYSRSYGSSYIDLAFVGKSSLSIWNTFELRTVAGTEAGGHKLVVLRTTCNINQGRAHKFYNLYNIQPKHFERLTQKTRQLVDNPNWQYKRPVEIRSRMDWLAIELRDTLLHIQGLKEVSQKTQASDHCYRGLTHRISCVLAKIKDERKVKWGVNKGKPTRKLVRLEADLRMGIDLNVRKSFPAKRGQPVAWTQGALDQAAEVAFPQIEHEYVCLVDEMRATGNLGKQIWLSREEISAAVKSLRRRKTVGPDEVSYNVLAAAYKHVPKLIDTICRMSFMVAAYPSCSSRIRGHMAPKVSEWQGQGGEPAGDALEGGEQQYRIVQISCALAALLERIAARRLRVELERIGGFAPNQYAYVPGRSTKDLLARIVERASKHAATGTHRSHRRLTTLFKLDLKSAFDLVDHTRLVKRVLEQFSHTNLTFWILNFITSRVIRLEMGGVKSGDRFICRGVPQGSSLGPALFAYYLSPALLADIQDPRYGDVAELLAYADDLFLSCKDNSTANSPTCDIFQYCLDTTVSHLEEQGLQVNMNKCAVIHMQTGTLNLSFRADVAAHEFCIGETPIKCIDGTKETISLLGADVGCREKRQKNQTADCKIKISQEKLYRFHAATIVPNVRRLFMIRKLKAVDGAARFRGLCRSLLVEPFLAKFMPILAADQTTHTIINHLVLVAIKQAFMWPETNSGDPAIRLILQVHSVDFLARQCLEKRIAANCDNKQAYELLLALLMKQLVSPTASIEPVQLNGGEAMFVDPAYSLPVFYYTDLAHFNEHLWLVREHKEGAYAVRCENGRLSRKLATRCPSTQVPYYHLVALFQLMLSPASQLFRANVLLRSGCSLLAKLQNLDGNSAYAIDMRRQISSARWKIISVDKTVYDEYHGKVFRDFDLNTSYTEAHDESPQLGIAMSLNRLAAEQRRAQAANLEQYHSVVTRALHPDPRLWANIEPQRVNGRHLNVLSDRITKGVKVWGHATIKEEDKLTHFPGCDPNVCPLDSNGVGQNIYLHRLFECPRFEDLRARLKLPQDLEGRHKRVAAILTNYFERSNLMDLIYAIS